MNDQAASPRRRHSAPPRPDFDVASFTNSHLNASLQGPFYQQQFSPLLAGTSSDSVISDAETHALEIMSQLGSFSMPPFYLPERTVSYPVEQASLLAHTQFYQSMASKQPETNANETISSSSTSKNHKRKGREEDAFQKPPLLPHNTPVYAFAQSNLIATTETSLSKSGDASLNPQLRIRSSRRGSSASSSNLAKISIVPGSEVPRAIPADAVIARSTGNPDRTASTEASSARYKSAVGNVLKRRGSLSSMNPHYDQTTLPNLYTDSLLSSSAPTSMRPTASGLLSMGEVLKAAMKSLEAAPTTPSASLRSPLLLKRADSILSTQQTPAAHAANNSVQVISPDSTNRASTQEDLMKEMFLFDNFESSALLSSTNTEAMNSMTYRDSIDFALSMDLATIAPLANNMYSFSGLTPLLGHMSMLPTPPRSSDLSLEDAANAASAQSSVYWAASLEDQMAMMQSNQFPVFDNPDAFMSFNLE
ncbi:hypothetical protein BDR26DRAFT_850591 [Obelidium mucronatum]|nr:hypothetical protein BDR26DRAFT_850591 [Obelidium mucronatum]